jgi:Excreted virulence factor EspC, type VII ESX diderm
MDSYKVVTAELLQHARTLDGLEAQVRTASDAAGGTSVTDDAYGELCREVPAILRQLARAGQANLTATAAAFDEAMTDMNDTAADYDRREANTKARFT